MRKAAAGLPHSKSLLSNIMRDTAGTARPGNAFVAALAKIRDRDHFLLAGYVMMRKQVQVLIGEPKKDVPSTVVAMGPLNSPARFGAQSSGGNLETRRSGVDLKA